MTIARTRLPRRVPPGEKGSASVEGGWGGQVCHRQAAPSNAGERHRPAPVPTLAA
eukprot:CAMPEP_0172624074 /NCGR_PEP_ID=MMETSP1068-20121228/133720_1 /TAXON_ID=35684 /ORGANISM="Pseudopedinella elastica, Strain CCMP716" /LENGTH=54 /DNA_ID=CAMNT_0013432879 /DNA_START=402 /DNA_END=561 /DNA_ORIENTATION=+